MELIIGCKLQLYKIMIQVPNVVTGLSTSKTSFKGSFTRKSNFVLRLKVKERRKRLLLQQKGVA